VPALKACHSGARAWLTMASAICERQELPVHKNKTRRAGMSNLLSIFPGQGPACLIVAEWERDLG